MSSEKGFTLIELLGALVLFSLITISAVTVTAQALQQDGNAKQTNSLRNDATYVTQVLRTAYENDTLDKVCVENGTIQTDDIHLQLTPGNQISEINFSYPGENSSNCFHSQPEKQTLQVNFTISSEDNETFDVDTAFTKPTTDDLTVTISQPAPPPTNPDNGGGHDGKDEEEPGEPTTPGEGEEDPGDNPDNPGDGGTETPSNPDDEEPKPETPDEPDTDSPILGTCKVLEDEIVKTNTDKGKGNGNKREDSVYTVDTTLSETQFNTNNYNSVKVSNGSLTIPNSVSIHKILFEVDHDFNVNGSLDLQESSDTNIGNKTSVNQSLGLFAKSSLETGTLFITNQLTAHNQSVLMVHGNVEVGSGHFFTKSASCVGGDATYKNDLEFQNFSTYTSGGKLSAPVLKMYSQSTVKVEKAAEIAGNLNLENDARLEIGKDIYAGGDTTLNSSAYVTANGPGTFKKSLTVRNSAELSINGNAVVDGTTLIETNAKLNVSGAATFDNDITLRNSGGQFTINENTTVNGSINMDQSAIMYVKGDLHITGNLNMGNSAKIIADGNIKVDSSTGYNWSNATVCAGGSNSIKQSDVPNMKILNNQKCQK
ncbi:prepilin-type N-terminal cleavage/methylation domain-containing protein [Terribacillus saccharophilus]|uniref:prepilin-type N-terminal cleavage/methylation domain-containing protein n=1 Tax=Terribacillus saccharophilus TaxID=361277 RepID=UPI002DC7D9F3|nr:prepilin-type N-terminal cleavage/methylation domain-containing protein [Terribacillus saccharophilus]